MTFNRKVHVSRQTLELLNGEFQYESGSLNARNDPVLLKNNIETFLISPKFKKDVNNSTNCILNLANETLSSGANSSHREKKCRKETYAEQFGKRKKKLMTRSLFR